MKYLLIILLVVIGYSFMPTVKPIRLNATIKRDTVPTGAAPQLFGGKLYEFRNYVLIDSFLMVQGGDTFAIPRWPGLKYKTSDNRWYGYHGSRWRAFLNGTDTVSLSNRIDSADQNLQQVTDKGNVTTDTIIVGGLQTSLIMGDTTDEDDFEIDVFPDLQGYSGIPRIAPMDSMFNWIVNNRTTENIKAVFQVGDLTNVEGFASEFVRVDTQFDKLDLYNIPYMPVIGNHDYAAPYLRDASTYNTYFGPTRYTGKSYYGGCMNGSNENFFILFEAGGRKYAAIGLEFLARDTALNWAQRIIDSLPTDREIIIVTHAFVGRSGERGTDTTLHGNISEYAMAEGNTPEQIWQKFIKRNKRIFLVLSGHFINGSGTTPPVVKRITSGGTGGNVVYQIVCNYQQDTLSGNGYFMRMKFKPRQNKIDVSFYSPYLGYEDARFASYELSYPAIRMEGAVGISDEGGGLTVAGETVFDSSVFVTKLPKDRIVITQTLGRLDTIPYQTANTVLAGPTTGAAANPTFRALVANDIPAGNNNYIQNQTAAAQTAGFYINTPSIISTTNTYRPQLAGNLPADLYIARTGNAFNAQLSLQQGGLTAPRLAFWHTQSTDLNIRTPSPTGDALGVVQFLGNRKSDSAITDLMNLTAFVRNGVTHTGAEFVLELRDTLTGNRTDRFHVTSMGDVRIGGTATTQYRLHIQSGDAYFAGNSYHIGNVGIGTASPLFGLHVNKSMGINKDSLTYATSSGARQILVLDTATNRVERMNLDAGATLSGYAGVIYKNNTWTTLDTFINNSTTSAVVANKIELSGGSSASDFSKSLDLKYYTGRDRWMMTTQFNAGTKEATSYGVGIGLNSTSAWSGHDHDIVAKINLSTDADAGKITLHNNNGTSYTTVATSTSALSFSSNDVIYMTIERIQDSVIALAKNITTGSDPITVGFRWSTTSATNPLPNTGRFALYSFGGTQTIDTVAVTSKNVLGNTIVLGDSKAYYFANNYVGLFGQLLNRQIPADINGGPGDRTTEMLTRLQEVKDLKPRQVIIETFRNDTASGMTFAQSIANIETAIDSLQSWNIPFYLLPLQEVTINLSQWNNYFATNYPNSYLPVWDVTGMLVDNVHPNAAMHDTLSKLIVQSMRLKGGTNDISTLQTVTDAGATTSNRVTVNGLTSNSTATINGATTVNGNLVLNPTTSAASQATLSTNGFLSYRATNANTGTGAAAGVLTANDQGFGLLLYSGSSTNAFIANGTLVGSNGPGGLHMATISGADISFGGSFTKGSSEWARFVSGRLGINTTTPLFGLHVNRSMGINKDSVTLSATTGPRHMLVLDTTTNSVERMAVPATPTTLYTGNSTITSDRTVNTGGNTLTITGANDNETSFTVTNTGTTSASAIAATATGTTSTAISGTSTQYIGVLGTSTSNNGLQGQSTSGTGVVGTSSTGAAFRGQIEPVSTDAIENAVTLLRRTSSGAGANGLGAAIQYELETATSGTSQVAGSFAFKWTDATNLTRTSMAEIYGVNSGTTARKAALAGNGQWTWDGYGAGTHTGTPTGSLQVTSSGDVIEGPALAAGTYTPTLTNGTNVTSSTASSCQYMRVGNTVTVSGKVNITPTGTGATALGISLPIASAIANDNECGGTGTVGNTTDLFGSVRGDATNDRAELVFTIGGSGTTTAQDWYFTFTYRIL